MTQEKKWWASFDPETFKYTGMRLSAEQPENATSAEIGDLINPVWNPTLNKWEGDSLTDQMAKLQAEADKVAQDDTNDDNAKDLPIAQLTETVATLKETTDTSISALMLQVAQLQSSLTDTASSSQPENNTPESK